MRYLGLDVGTKKIGMSMSDRSFTLAYPYKVIEFTNVDDAVQEVVDILWQYDIIGIVIGLPKNMNNTSGPAVERTLEFKKQIEEVAGKGIPVYLIDERLTTVEAEKLLIDRGYSRAKRKDYIDGVAAVFILETFLNMKKESEKR